MAATYNLITAAIPGHSGRYSRDSGRSPVLQMTHDSRLVCFLANSFERMPSAALCPARIRRALVCSQRTSSCWCINIGAGCSYQILAWVYRYLFHWNNNISNTGIPVRNFPVLVFPPWQFLDRFLQNAKFPSYTKIP